MLRRGDARMTVLLHAGQIHADLIAVGTHGRSGIAYTLVGSVAEWIVANAEQDVVMARPVRFTFRQL